MVMYGNDNSNNDKYVPGIDRKLKKYDWGNFLHSDINELEENFWVIKRKT